MRDYFSYLILTLCLWSCHQAEVDELILDFGSREKAIALEEKLGSEKVESNPTSALPWKFLPVDSQFVMTNPVKYQRVAHGELPMSTRIYSDSLGNDIIVYEWDLVQPGMEDDEVFKLKESFDDHHKLYADKYNQLIAQVSERIGAPLILGEQLKKHEMEAYKNWSIETRWEIPGQVIELKILLVPTEVYRIILKNFVFKNPVDKPKN